MSKHPSSAYRMQEDYSRSLPRNMHRNMDHESRSMCSKPRDTSAEHSDIDNSRNGTPGNMYQSMYATMPRGMHPGMYGGGGGMPGFGMPRMMEYPMEMPRRYSERPDRSMEGPYGRFSDMSQGRYMSSHDRLMNMMQNRHMYGRSMDQGRMGMSMYGNMEPRRRHMDDYE